MKSVNIGVCTLLAVCLQVAAAPLPCAPAAPTDPAPWNHNFDVLSSFPRVSPAPRFVGAFGDADYELHVWRDSEGIFGELLHPLLDADSPTSRLYKASFGPATAKVRFEARFREERAVFTGRMTASSVTGSLTDAAGTHEVRWRKLREDEAHGVPGADFWRSRAQFDCAMILFHRF